MNNSTIIYSDDIEMGNNNEVNEVEGTSQLGRSLSIISKGTIQIDKLTIDSPILLNLSPNSADRKLIIDVIRSMDANKDGVIDYIELVQILVSLCGQLREKEHAEFEKKLAQWRLIVGLSVCLVLSIASTFASSFASVFIAKDTTISNKRNGQTISTSAAELHYDLFGTDDEEELDTTSEKDTTTVTNNKLGCIGGLQNQIEALAKGSLSQPVILTDAKGGVHKIDEDAACAASTEGRRLQQHLGYETIPWGVVITHCDMEYTWVTSDMYNSSENVQDGFREVYCHGQWGMNWASQNP